MDEKEESKNKYNTIFLKTLIPRSPSSVELYIIHYVATTPFSVKATGLVAVKPFYVS